MTRRTGMRALSLAMAATAFGCCGAQAADKVSDALALAPPEWEFGEVTILAGGSAAGALFSAQQKWQDAIAQLEEDHDDPFSMQLLSRAYYEAGANEKMHAVEERLRGTNVPTIEQAVVVPAARMQKPSTT